MGCQCLICNSEIRAPPGPSRSKAKLKFKKDKFTRISKDQCKVLCKALNIPLLEYSTEIMKFPMCPVCCKKVQKMTHIISALERLQDTVRQFRGEVKAMLEDSYDADYVNNKVAFIKGEDALSFVETSWNEEEMEEETGGRNYATESDDGTGSGLNLDIHMKDMKNNLRKQIIDVLKNKVGKSNASDKDKPKTATTTPVESVKVPPPHNKKKIKQEFGTQFLIDECRNRKAVVSLTRLDSLAKSDSNSLFPDNPVITKVTSRPKKSVLEVGVFHGMPFQENYGDSDDDNDWTVPSSPPAVYEDEDGGHSDHIDNDDKHSDVVPCFKLVQISPSHSPEPGCSTDKVIKRSKSKRKASLSPAKSIQVQREQEDSSSNESKPLGDDDESDFQIEAVGEELGFDSWDDEDLAPPKQKSSDTKTKRSRGKVERNFPCKSCHRSFRTDFDLQVHVRKVHKGLKKVFVCSWEGCEKSFEKKFKWRNHMEFHKTGESTKKYTCPTCNKSYDCNNSLQRHMSNHTGNWKYPCTMCNKGFHRPGELESHIRRHDNNLSVVRGGQNCSYCDEKFPSSRMRIKHESLMHPDQDLKQNTRCEYCQKVFSSTDTLRCHRIQLHTGEYNFHCDECGKGFAKESWMVRHKLQHTQERNFPCDQCPEKFRFPNSLAAHKLKHLGKYPFECKFCDKKFILRSQLNVHEPLHSKEKPFICEYCGKSFSIEYYMNHHIKRVHYTQVGLSAPPEYYKAAAKRKKEKAALKPKPKSKEPKKKKRKLNTEESACDKNGDNTDTEMNDGSMVQVEVIVRDLEESNEKQFSTQTEEENSEEATQVVQQEVEVETQKIDIDNVKVESDNCVEIVVSESE